MDVGGHLLDVRRHLRRRSAAGGGGAAAAARGPARGFDLETQVELTLAEVATGAEKTIEFERQDTCETCKGTGAKPGSIAGRLRAVRRAGPRRPAGLRRDVPHGHHLPQLPRPRNASSATIARPAAAPAGSCKKRVVTVKIPAGVHEGQAVRIAGEGEAGEAGAPAGDLHCYIAVKPHPIFTPAQQRSGLPGADQLHAGGARAARSKCRRSRAREELDIPAGTQHGEVFKLKGKGLPDIRSYRNGDELVQILIEIPKKLTEKQKQLLREFAATEDGNVDAAAQGISGQAEAGFQQRPIAAVRVKLKLNDKPITFRPSELNHDTHSN